jgi:hypothetical protein
VHVQPPEEIRCGIGVMRAGIPDGIALRFCEKTGVEIGCPVTEGM